MATEDKGDWSEVDRLMGLSQAQSQKKSPAVRPQGFLPKMSCRSFGTSQGGD